jgi:hypothetical protein
MALIGASPSTSTTPFSSFLPEVLPFVHDVPQFVAENAVRNSAIEFCRRSYIWQVDISAIDVLANSRDYLIPTPVGTTMESVMEAWYNGILLIPRSAEELTRLYFGADWRSAKAIAPSFITSITPGRILLVPTPTTTLLRGLTIRAAIAPLRSATSIDSFIYETQLEVIAHGARARLYSMAGQPFFDVTAAEVYRRQFLAGVADARVRANKGISRAPVAIEFQRFV